MMTAGPPRLLRQRVRAFWRARLDGLRIEQAAASAGVSATGARRWITEAGGMIPDLDQPSGRYLSLAERDDIGVGWTEGLTNAAIGRRLGATDARSAGNKPVRSV